MTPNPERRSFDPETVAEESDYKSGKNGLPPKWRQASHYVMHQHWTETLVLFRSRRISTYPVPGITIPLTVMGMA